MYSQDSTVRGPKYQTSKQHIGQPYLQMTKHGKIVAILDDGVSKFDRVIGNLGDIEEGAKVCLANDKSCTGTVKWIGRGHEEPGTEVDEKDYIVGVKMDSMRGVYQHQCSRGDLDGENVVTSRHKDILFGSFLEWVPIKERRPAAGGAAGAKKSKDSTQNAANSCDTLVRQSAQSKFDRVDLNVNGFHVGSRVKLLDTGSIGTARWIGCYHKKVVKLDDYIIGVELDDPDFEPEDTLTDGKYCGERLVYSQKNNVVFAKLQHCAWINNADTKPKAATKARTKRREVSTLDGIPIEIYHDGHSAYDKVLYGIDGIKEGDKVHLHSDKTRAGTVKWIGCDHGKTSQKNAKDFLVGVQMEKPKMEQPDMLTDGTLHGETLVFSQRKNVMFTKLKYWSLIKPEKNVKKVKDTKTQRKEVWSTVYTPDGIPIEIYDDGTSRYDRVPHGVDGIQVGNRVYLYSEKTRTGTVKWIGCDHGKASNTDLKDFLVGVEMDKPEKERDEALTCGDYNGHQLVATTKKNVRFLKLKYWTLVEPERQDPLKTDTRHQSNEMWSVVYTLDDIPIEIYHDGKSTYDRLRYGIDGIQDGNRVYLYSDKTRAGTVKWIGCNHGQASNTDPKDFLVGVEMDSPEKERDEALTYGDYNGQKLVVTTKRNVRFLKLKYWTLAEPERETPKTDPKHQSKEVWSTVCISEDIPFEIYDDGKSAFDRVSSGIDGIKDGYKVYLYSDRTRAGTVKWIGCDHGQASNTDPKDFLVGVKMDKPEKERDEALTYGDYNGEQLVATTKKNVRFLRLEYWTLVEPETLNPLKTDSKYKSNDTEIQMPKSIEKKMQQPVQFSYTTRCGVTIAIQYDGSSKFDKVVGKLGDMEEGDRVCLHNDESCTGTVKWIGRYHVDPDIVVDEEYYIMGVKLDAVNPSLQSYCTSGDLENEHLVPTTKRDVIFKHFLEWVHVDVTPSAPPETMLHQQLHNNVNAFPDMISLQGNEEMPYEEEAPPSYTDSISNQHRSRELISNQCRSREPLFPVERTDDTAENGDGCVVNCCVFQ